MEKLGKLVLLGVAVSAILALNIPGRFGLAGGIVSAVVLIGLGFLTKKFHVPSVISGAMVVAGGLVIGQSFVAPMLAGFAGGQTSEASAPLTHSTVTY